jgi:hypothetical protein
VSLEFAGVKPGDHSNPLNHGRNAVQLVVKTDKGSFNLDLMGRQSESIPANLTEDLILTAFHEAGHAIVTKVYFHGFKEPEYIKILPGVTRIMEKWIYYAGVASSEETMRTRMDIATVLREIAVLMGGTVGEDLIVRGGTASAGKSNDIERATKIAETAILKWGLLPEWGNRVDDKEKMSEADRILFGKLVKELLDEGHLLAEEAITANADTFVAMGNAAARKGILNKVDLQKIFAETKVKVEAEADLVAAAKANAPLFERQKDETAQRRRGMKIEFNKNLKILAPTEVVDLNAELEKQRSIEIAKLLVDHAIPMGLASEVVAPALAAPAKVESVNPNGTPRPTACEGLLKTKSKNKRGK